FGQRDEQAHRLVGGAVLRIVEADTGRFDHHPLTSRRIGGEQVTEVHALDLAVVSLERLPRRKIAPAAHGFTSSARTASESTRQCPMSATRSSAVFGPNVPGSYA